MNNVKFILISILLFLSFMPSFAQRTIYAEVGLNTCRMHKFNNASNYFKPKITPSIAINVRNILIGNTLYYHYGFGYQQLGEKMHRNTNSFDDASYNITVNYIRFPAKVEFKYYNFQAFGGFYASRYVSGNIKYDGVNLWLGSYDFSNKGKERIYGGSSHKEDKLSFNNWDFGYMFSLGYKIKQYGINLNSYIGIRRPTNLFSYNYRLYDFIEELYSELNNSQNYGQKNNYETVKNRNFSLSFTYYFGNQHYK